MKYLFLVLVILSLSFGAGEESEYCVSEGLFPSDPKVLWDEVSSFVKTSHTQFNFDEPLGILVPEESYVFSGIVLGAAFSSIMHADKDLIVFVVSAPEGHEGVNIVMGKRFATPLGTVPTDSVLAHEILRKTLTLYPTKECPTKGFWYSLPFVQYVFHSKPILVFVVGRNNIHNMDFIARSCAEAISGRKPLVIIASNLAESSADKCVDGLANKSLKMLLRLNVRGLKKAHESGDVGLSSYWAVLFGLKLLRQLGADSAILLKKFANYGFPARRAVSMAAIVWVKSRTIPGRKVRHKQVDIYSLGDVLWEYTKALLLEEAPPRLPDEVANVRCGIFVTIEKNNRMVARVGSLFPAMPAEVMLRNIVNSIKSQNKLVSDFMREGGEITLRLGLARMVDCKVESSRNLGIYVRLGGRDGIIMPWEENDLPAKARLERACIQAGLPAKSWELPDAEVYFFELKTFENEIRLSKASR